MPTSDLTRPRLPLPIVLGASLLPALAVWLASVGNPLEYVAQAAPPGQVWYVAAKLAGLAAGMLLAVQILLMLAGRGWTLREHRFLGVIAFGLVLLHVGCFVTAASLRTGTPALDLLVPSLADGPYERGLALGALALWLLLAAVLAGAARRWKAAGLVHKAGMVGFALALLHASIVGSEQGLVSVLVLAAVVMAVALAWRLLGSGHRPTPARRRGWPPRSRPRRSPHSP